MCEFFFTFLLFYCSHCSRFLQTVADSVHIAHRFETPFPKHTTRECVPSLTANTATRRKYFTRNRQVWLENAYSRPGSVVGHARACTVP